MFHILKGRVKFKEFPIFRWRDGDRFIIRLWGINFMGERVEPVYISLLRLFRGGGYLAIETPAFIILLLNRRPWIIFEKASELEIKDE